MPDHDHVRRIASALPQVIETEDRFGFAVVSGGKPKGFIWAWLERIHTKKARVPSDEVVGIRVADLQEKEALLAQGHPALFTEPHYNGYPAVLVKLPEVDPALLEELIVDGWCCVAPKKLVREWESSNRAEP